MSLTILRISIGIMMLFFHGLPKLQSASQLATQFPDPIGLGSALSLYLVIFAECFCSIFLILGVYTRLSCIPPIVTMLVAIFIIHGNDPWPTIELPGLYLMGYIALFIGGGGRYPLPFPTASRTYLRWLTTP
jgi:putative oxidoreductase